MAKSIRSRVASSYQPVKGEKLRDMWDTTVALVYTQHCPYDSFHTYLLSYTKEQ